MKFGKDYLAIEVGGGTLGVIKNLSLEKIFCLIKKEYPEFGWDISEIKAASSEYFEIWLYNDEDVIMERTIKFERIEIF